MTVYCLFADPEHATKAQGVSKRLWPGLAVFAGGFDFQGDFQTKIGKFALFFQPLHRIGHHLQRVLNCFDFF